MRFRVSPAMGISMAIAMAAASVAAVVAAPSAESAITVANGFSVKRITSGLTDPTAMEILPDGRIFVSERAGSIRLIKNGKLRATPFLKLSVRTEGSRGLFGIAFHPDFPDDSYVYVHYTPKGSLRNQISRFKVKGDVAVKSTETVLLTLDKQSSVGHHGGSIHFGPDRKLYIPTGDNNDQTTPKTNAKAQRLDNLFGKVLRINRDGSAPADNPFVGTAKGSRKAIWARGLRNPFTFAFQPSTGTMFINDVGSTKREEINEGVAGANYGWPVNEGPTSAPYTSPVYSYPLGGSPSRCALTGGAFYNPVTQQFPAQYAGDYFFADYCAGLIVGLDVATKTEKVLARHIANPVDLRVSRGGTLYYLAHAAGAKGKASVGRIRWVG